MISSREKRGIIVKYYIEETLTKLGIKRTYRGYYLVLNAVLLVLEDETRLLKVTDKIYKPVSIICQCSLPSVERNIRTVIYRVWSHNRKELNDINGYALDAPPMVSEFIDMLSMYISNKYSIKAK